MKTYEELLELAFRSYGTATEHADKGACLVADRFIAIGDRYVNLITHLYPGSAGCSEDFDGTEPCCGRHETKAILRDPQAMADLAEADRTTDSIGADELRTVIDRRLAGEGATAESGTYSAAWTDRAA